MRIPSALHPLLTVLLAALALAGCAGPSPTRLEARLAADDGLNPDIGGRPSPVVVRLYALSSPDALQNADFFSLYDNDTVVLKDSALAREELEVLPGSSVEISREFPPATQYLGVVAAFRDIDRSQWRAVAPLEKEGRNTLTIELGERSVSISTH